MTDIVTRNPGQPFTLGGVARYARATFGRLFGMGMLFALVSGAVLTVLFATRWSPVIGDAIANLPESSLIRGGSLSWPEQKAKLLAASPFLSLAYASEGATEGAPVDVAIEFSRLELRVRSVLGIAIIPYPSAWTIALNRTTLLPLWGAWEKALPGLVLFAGSVGLLLVWSLLGMAYTLIFRFFALILGKRLTFGAAWKVCVAAQWPGAVLLGFVLLLYAAGQTSFVLVLAAFAAHFVLTLLYLVFSPICLPRAGANPFATEEPARHEGGRRKNPFA